MPTSPPPGIPCLPENAPFTAEQRAWVNGFLAGILSGTPAAAPAAARTAVPRRPLLIAFGSQTGSAQGLAKRLAREAGQRGFDATLKELNAVESADLTGTSPCVIITSTWGDGDPPENAAAFWTRLGADSAPRLEHLAFAVLGLGDRNYSDFCGAARRMDERLAALGARRLLTRGECDVDYDATARAWMDSLWPALEGSAPAPGASAAAAPAVPDSPVESTVPAPVGFSRAHPFPARLTALRRLNREGSGKDTRHFEISLEGSGLRYEPGDALGVMPSNCPALVEELLAVLGFGGEEPVADEHQGPCSLHELLSRRRVITSPPASLLKDAAARSANAELTALLDPARKADLDRWLHGRDVVDVLRSCPGARFEAQEFAQQLRRLQPRLYSISSSPRAHPGEVHLTIGTVRYEAHGRLRKGVCSCWLADRVVPGETPVPVFVQTSHGFRLPADPERPIILIGPGTGIAPFRAFLEEREVTGARGRNWLFFGDQQRDCDFLYEEQVSAWVENGLLTRLDLAFSRDQADKVYVQNRMLENAALLWSWLDSGAHVYVCGDARRMARDVDAALHRIVESAGGRTPEQAADYVANLKTTHRYQRDVY